MKQFTLVIQVNEPRLIERVEADDMLQLLAQFNLVIASTMKQIENYKERHRIPEDDIPF